MKRTIWQPLVLGLALGLLAGIATVTDLAFFIADTTENAHAIGFFVTLFLLVTALGGLWAGVSVSTIWVTVEVFFGLPDMKGVIAIQSVFWSNIIAIGITLTMAGIAYGLSFEGIRMPMRLIPWVGIVHAFYIFTLPFSLTLQYYIQGNPLSEIYPAISQAHSTYVPQAIFDILITCLVLIALPLHYRKPFWFESKNGASLIDIAYEYPYWTEAL